MKNIRELNVTWVTRSFLDYRIPVFKCLDEVQGGRFELIYSGDYVPASVAEKARKILGDRAHGMCGEWKLGQEDCQYMANKNTSIRYQPGVFKAIRQTKPDVLICDGFFKWTLPSLIYRIRYGTPLIVCYERWRHTERHAQWYRILYRKIALRYIDAMCCNGSLSREYTIKLGMSPDRITTGHMAADTGGLSAMVAKVTDIHKKELRIKLGVEGLVYLYVGKLTKRKGLAQLLDAWSLFEKQVKGGTLLIVGGGGDECRLKELCNSTNLRQVRFVGPVAYDEVANLYSAADVFIIPTLEDNWSLVVPEAMACGLPVLCSKYNGCWPELIHEGKNGWVFDPLDQSDILRVLNVARDAAHRLNEMGDRSREMVAVHSPENAARSILSACQIAMRTKKQEG